ncbi:membrane protein [Ralstonia solanacearum]|nr:membrane protein [Ralstonia solanacearum]
MRPLVRPVLPAAAAAMHAPSGLLMNAFGHFCAFCERPLLDESWVWDARTGRCVDDAPGSAADWAHLYLLDRNCYEAQLAASPVDPAALLLPDQPGAFDPSRPDSPLAYTLQRLTRVLTDEAGRHTGPAEAIDRVVVTGKTPPARATIDYFALNTAYYRADTQSLEIPEEAFLQLADRRMDQRTLAWQRAANVAAKMPLAPRAALGYALAEQLRLLVGAMGFWSSCVSAAYPVIENRSVMRQVFVEPQETRRAPPPAADAIIGMAAREAARFGGNGPYHTFPGTRDLFRPDTRDTFQR